ncbi:hypothetical protein E8E11_008222 [Didymella keratinophila]|nr:hypothetical protein E8E11_008222 [Didymella keratinophila]
MDIQKCPLDIRAARAYQPWRIHFKPESAGVRVLTLDGGGIRGIVELEILQGIETVLGGKLRVQNLIDLIVGTSTGGLVALGLVSQNWSVHTCINNFKELCEKAFTRRFGSNMPFIGWFVDNINHSKYETTPLQEALKVAFTEDQYLFGGQRLDQNWSSPVKVAVTTTSSSSSPVVLANYNRRCEGKLSYQFQRPEGVENELKTWEAARATSAAPRYFRPYLHAPSKQIYMDGAIYHNNPIRIADTEWKLIWSRGPITHPDIMLSLGTGLAADQDERSLKSPISRRGLIQNGKMLLKIATDHIAAALDCEKTWHDYIRPLIVQEASSRFIRYNVELDGDLPSLDDVKSLSSLQEEVKKKVSQDARITNLAFQLMTTCFYFDVERIQQGAQNTAVATGRLYCRFADGSLEMQELGNVIRNQSYRNKNPFFLVREKGMHGKTESRERSLDIVGSMINQGKFPIRKMNIQLRNKLSDVEIYLFLNDGQHHSISGFPRCLFNDENDKAIDSLYADPTDEASERVDSLINSPPPYVSGRQPAFPGDTEFEKAATRTHELAQPSPAVTPPPAYNNSTRHSEGYNPYRPEPDAMKVDAAQPRSESHVLTEEQVRWQGPTRRVIPIPETQSETTTVRPELAEQDIADTFSITLSPVPSPVPSPDITPVERVPSLPHTLPPLGAFETVSFSITMDRSAPTDSPISPSNTSGTSSQWRWDIQF